MYQYQDILNDIVGYGKAQEKLLMPVNMLLFTEGCQSVVISLMLPELEREWGVSTFQKSLLITMIYLGVGVGSFLQSWADKYGRIVFIKWNAILQTIFGILCCFSTQIQYFIFFRFIYGIGIGIILPISGTYISQITPSKYRSLLITKSKIYWVLGCLFTMICGWLLLRQHHWRILLFIICLPGIYALYLIYQTNQQQTLRYLWLNQRTSQVHQLINYMLNQNQPTANNHPQKQQLSKHYIHLSITQQLEQNKHLLQTSSYADVFNQKYFYITVCLMMSWFSGCFIFYGTFLLFPTILVQNNLTSYNLRYGAFIVITLAEIGVYLFTNSIISHQYFGRRRTLYLTFLISAIAAGLLIIYGKSSTSVLLITFAVIRISLSVGFVTVLPYTIQIYPTLIRSRGVGINSMVGRVGAICLGFVGLQALEWFDGNGLYMIFLLLSVMSFYAIYKMPYCTLGRPLDA